MVNEYWNSNGGPSRGSKMARNEFIEFVIVEATSAAELAAMTFGDTNNGTSKLNSVFTFDLATLDSALAGASLTQFLPGTIIVVKGTGLGAQDLGYDPFSNTNDGWKIELVAGQGALDHPETVIDGNFSIDSTGDVVWISSGNPPANDTDTSGFIHAIGHDTNPGLIATTVAAAFGAENIVQSSLGTNRGFSNVGGATEVLASSTSTTMGVANSGANAAWITTNRLLAVPEPQRVGLMALGVLGALIRRKRNFHPRHG